MAALPPIIGNFMLTAQQISNNTQRFKDLVSEISRLTEDDVNRVLSYLDSTDFFIAPASTKYHNAYDGGLCEHSLHVYDYLCKLYDTFKFKLDDNDIDSLKIVALFHDVGRADTYKKEIKHRKLYKDDGSSYWEDYIGYSFNELKDRFSVGNHEENCAYLASTLIPLRPSEYSAILNHHGGLDWSSTKQGPADSYCKYPIAMYLHFADMVDAYDEQVR